MSEGGRGHGAAHRRPRDKPFRDLHDFSRGRGLVIGVPVLAVPDVRYRFDAHRR